METMRGLTALVVEDDHLDRLHTVACLEKAGFKVIEAAGGEEAVSLAQEQVPEVIVLDIMLPDLDGFGVCERLHDLGIDSIVIMLTVRTEDVDKIHGLGVGADDYMVKPYNPDELVARIKAIFRRWQHHHKSDDVLGYKDVQIDYKDLKAYKDGEELNLTLREITILSMFLHNQNRLLTREDLYKCVYHEDHFTSTNVIDVYMKRLREKIEADPHKPEVLKTIWGKGYVCGEYHAEHHVEHP
jgi:DNA-binding response OmpR family regulator